jgi:pimeloyl-ACP methyl ester carboxylesterase
MHRLLALILWGCLLGGCTTAVNYGRIAHSVMATGLACNPDHVDSASFVDKPYFVITSRLPDCTRSDRITLTAHRSDRQRYLRFASPVKPARAKPYIPFAMSPEHDWWDALEIKASKADGHVLVYVHGYRETPFTSAKDAAQIARLSEYDGAVIAFAWPSQGKLLSYLVDETNMEANQRNFGAFLAELATKKWAKDIVLVSHSMGVRLLLPAINEADLQTGATDSPIRKIILVSPDIDQQIFESEAASGFMSADHLRAGRRVTIYASRKDKALAISRNLHGYPRLGSPYCFDRIEAEKLKASGLPVRCYVHNFVDITSGENALTVVDTTGLAHRGTAHSDYLGVGPACTDFAKSVRGDGNSNPRRIATHFPHAFMLVASKEDKKLSDKELCHKD